MSVEVFLDQYTVQPVFIPVTDRGGPARFHTYGAATIALQNPSDEGKGIISLRMIASQSHQRHRDMWEAARALSEVKSTTTPPDSTIAYTGRRLLVAMEQSFQPGSVISHPLLRSTVYISSEEGPGVDEWPGFPLLSGLLHVAGASVILQSNKVAKLNARANQKGVRPIQPEQCAVSPETIIDHRSSSPRRQVARTQPLRNLVASLMARQHPTIKMA